MLKTFNKASTRCPVVVYDEINAVFEEINQGPAQVGAISKAQK